MDPAVATFAGQPPVTPPIVFAPTWDQLGKNILGWPLVVPKLLSTMTIANVGGVVGSMVLAYYLFGNPLEIDNMQRVYQYLTVGAGVSTLMYAPAVVSQYM